ncbi:MAG: hypothetical protein S4CHLAM6_15870 [Chlamydiae bacterium]|nr:hypothetical protein [Chlamydiota bacterium]
MFSSVSSYFFPESVKNSLDEAMRTGDLSLVDTLVKSGSNPSEKSSDGFTIIDHAIFKNQIKELPHLFAGASSDQVTAPKISQDIFDFSKTPEAKIFAENLSQISPENLHDKDSADFKSLQLALKAPISIVESKGNGFQTIHLLAMFAKPAVLKAVLEHNRDLKDCRDSHGNTPLHYSAFNPDQGAFVELSKAGANIFAVNSKSETPLGNLVALAQAKDPLQWAKKDIIIFLAQWLPTAVKAAYEYGYLGDEEMLAASKVLSFLGIAASISNFRFLLDSCRNRPRKFLFAIAYLSTNWIPIVGLPMHAYNTYVLASRALESLKLAYHHFGRRSLRSLMMAGVKSSNAYTSMQGLYVHGKMAHNLARIVATAQSVYARFEEYLSASSSDCGEMPEPLLFRGTKVNPEFPKYVDCANQKFEEIFNEELEKSPELDSFYYDVLKPMTTEYAKSCPESDSQGGGGSCFVKMVEHYVYPYFNINPEGNSVNSCGDYKPPRNMKTLSVVERIRAIGSPKGCLAKAKDILGLKNICDKKFRQLYGKISLKVHPDHLKEADAQSLFTYLGNAKEMLVNERKSAC